MYLIRIKDWTFLFLCFIMLVVNSIGGYEMLKYDALKLVLIIIFVLGFGVLLYCGPKFDVRFRKEEKKDEKEEGHEKHD